MTTAILKQTGCDDLPRTLMKYAGEHSPQEKRGRETPKAFANPLKDPPQGPKHCTREVNNWGRMAVQSHLEDFWVVRVTHGPVYDPSKWSSHAEKMLVCAHPPQPLALKIVYSLLWWSLSFNKICVGNTYSLRRPLGSWMCC